MKLKEINRTAIQAWSPVQQHPVYLAAGTSAQQLDATFSTNASLEIFELDLAEPTLAMKSCGSFSSPHRYHKLVWGAHGIESEGLPSGVLIAGGENGNIILYDASKIIAGDSEVIISQSEKHTGPVRALDLNSFQTNLVASGGNESEIYIWDLNSFSSPMTPGPKTQPLEDISCVAWNRQVQHILASASPSGKASVWDLRKNDLIIKVSDHSNRMHCSGLAWNPEVATQLVLASEDDRMPVIQMWDLRFATSPLKVLENHTRGVLAIAWSVADPELLLSCGKDNRILCWNPNTAEVLYELPTSAQWCFDIQWCPRNPAVLSAAAFDGHISIYSIMGGSNDNAINAQADQLSSSFGNMDPFGMGKTLPPLQLPQHTTTQSTITPLKKPPKWIRRPVGASFAFGGKLVTLDNIKSTAQQPQQTAAHVVHISQVVTETDFLDRSNQLQTTLTAGNFLEYCQTKVEAAQNEFEKTVWSFLKVNFEDDARGKYLELLGYKEEELAIKIASALEGDCKSDEANVVEENSPADEQAELSAAEMSDLDEIPVDDDDDEPVVEETSITEDSPSPSSDHVTAPALDVVNLKVSQDIDGLITQALLTGDYEAAVNLCLHDNRMADGIILAIAGGPELLAKTQKKYFTTTQSKISKLICAVLTKDWLEILETCDLQNWKEALAAVMTYAKPEEFSSLCGLLGSRLESAEDTELQAQACLCYICAGAVEQLVAYWAKAQDSNSPLLLQELVEKVVVLQRAVQKAQCGVSPDVGTLLAEKMNQYASLLASQGNLQTAISYLPSNTEQVAVQQLRDRLRRALGQELSTAVIQNTQPAIPAAASVQTYTPVQPQPPQVPTQSTTPAVPPQYYQQGRSATTVTSWSNQTPTALPSVPHPFVPTADPQAEPTPPAFGLQSTVNASVPSSTPFMYSQQYQNYPPVQQFTPALYQPVQYSSSAASCLPPPPSSSAASVYPPQFMHPAVSQPPPQGGQPFSPPPPSGVSFQHGGPGSPTAYLPPAVRRASGTEIDPALIPASQRTGGLNQDTAWSLEGPQNGWNDPPSLNRVHKKKKIPENYTPPAPITAPIMTPLGDPQSLAAPGTQTHHPQHQVPDQSVAPTHFNPSHQQSLGPPTQNPHLPQVHMEGAPGAPIGDFIKPLQSIPTEKITKKPIPEEHMVLKTTFEGLIQKCLAAASDPQTKRKLDDAHKRLEFLYDKLREQTLSPAIVGGLHNMAHSIECRSYTDGLNIHTHIVSNSNFSETSAFMPVLKVVLTQASKLGV
ncbi:protein transport protein Sec31A-like isoform X6 [Xyrauchen texanus]|uniref:protein transport protein Sec31A-like isoform X6 n=1 Tax=Xyrauchen texanus TaxID=154827 RepID=UPI0022421536|nr:protein transport protein Sec31A-like isoform X6 [Xyrauchen texanus]